MSEIGKSKNKIKKRESVDGGSKTIHRPVMLEEITSRRSGGRYKGSGDCVMQKQGCREENGGGDGMWQSSSDILVRLKEEEEEEFKLHRGMGR